MSFRLIPIILIDENRMVKTRKFKDPKYLGNPLNAVRIFNEKEVDELLVIDRSAGKKKELNWTLLADLASEAFMPMAYAGGLRQEKDVDRLFATGYEKVGLRSLCHEEPVLVRKLISAYGSQAIIGILDYEIDFWGRRKPIGYPKLSLQEACQTIESLGVGELMLQSISHEGCMNGFDLGPLSEIASNLKVPLVMSGGAKDLKHIIDAKNLGASAAAVGSMCSFVGDRDSILINYPRYETLIENGLVED